MTGGRKGHLGEQVNPKKRWCRERVTRRGVLRRLVETFYFRMSAKQGSSYREQTCGLGFKAGLCYFLVVPLLIM